jgi:hypothetical protein
MSKKIKELVADVRKRKLSGQDRPQTFVSGDVAAGTVREAEVQEDKPEEDPKTKK